MKENIWHLLSFRKELASGVPVLSALRWNLPKETLEELESASSATGWCDVCKGWESE